MPNALLPEDARRAPLCGGNGLPVADGRQGKLLPDAGAGLNLPRRAPFCWAQAQASEGPMPETMTSLFDPGALAIVVAGTVLACVARCGWRDFGAALREASRLVTRRGFNADANRKALALALTAIQRDGSHRADPALPTDRALGLMLESYLRHGTLEAVSNARRSQRAIDEARRISAAQVFSWAGELAPVFGMVGTLYGLTQLAPGDAISTTVTIMGAVSTAVLTSLYGALVAHLVCHPIASAIERRGLEEERARAALADWFVEQIARTAASAQERRVHLRGVA